MREASRPGKEKEKKVRLGGEEEAVVLQLRGRGRESLVGGLSPLGEFQGWVWNVGFSGGQFTRSRSWGGKEWFCTRCISGLVLSYRKEEARERGKELVGGCCVVAAAGELSERPAMLSDSYCVPGARAK